jgi:hypothetical protein
MLNGSRRQNRQRLLQILTDRTVSEVASHIRQEMREEVAVYKAKPLHDGLGCECRVLNGLFLGREGGIASQLLVLFLQLLPGARIRQA